MENLSRSRLPGVEKMNFPNVLFYMRNLTFLPSTLTDFSLRWLGDGNDDDCVFSLCFETKRIVVMIINEIIDTSKFS